MVHELYRIGAKAGIQSFEFVRGVHLETEQFTVDNGLLTGFLPLALACPALPTLFAFLTLIACFRACRTCCVCHACRVVGRVV